MPKPKAALIDVYPHPFKSDQRIVLFGCRATKAKDVGDKPIVDVVMTAGTEDRHGTVFNPDGWDFEPYHRNPVVLWSHMRKIPLIATARSLYRDGNTWRSQIEFAIDEWAAGGGFNLARVIYTMFANDKMRAMSQGFIPKAMKRREAQNVPIQMAENLYFDRQELTEQSAVNVPSNREAVRSAVGEGLISGNEIEMMLGLGFSLDEAEPIRIYGREQPNNTLAMATVGAGDTSYSPDDAAAGDGGSPDDASLLQDLCTELWDVVDTAVACFDQASDAGLRSYSGSIAANVIYAIDSLRSYADNAGLTVDLSSMASREETISRVRAIAEGHRIGAVLSQSNLNKVQQIQALLGQVVAHCEELITAATATAKNNAPGDNSPAGETTDSDEDRASEFSIDELTEGLTRILGGDSAAGRAATPTDAAAAPGTSDSSTPAEPPARKGWLSLLP